VQMEVALKKDIYKAQDGLSFSNETMNAMHQLEHTHAAYASKAGEVYQLLYKHVADQHPELIQKAEQDAVKIYGNKVTPDHKAEFSYKAIDSFIKTYYVEPFKQLFEQEGIGGSVMYPLPAMLQPMQEDHLKQQHGIENPLTVDMALYAKDPTVLAKLYVSLDTGREAQKGAILEKKKEGLSASECQPSKAYEKAVGNIEQTFTTVTISSKEETKEVANSSNNKRIAHVGSGDITKETEQKTEGKLSLLDKMFSKFFKVKAEAVGLTEKEKTQGVELP
jgi:hypothetical protein